MDVSLRLFLKSFVFFSLLLVFNASMAATLTVTNLDSKGPGSLPQTIYEAAPGDRIVFAVTGTIYLIGSEIVIDKQVSIIGPKKGKLALNGVNNNRVLFIKKHGVVRIENLTIENGYSWYPDKHNSVRLPVGGGIRIKNGKLILENVTIKDNKAAYGGGIYNNGGSFTLINTTISRNEAKLTNTNCDIPYDHAGDGFGAGIYTENEDSTATSEIINSTIVDNIGHCSAALYKQGNHTLRVVNSIIAADDRIPRFNAVCAVHPNTTNILTSNGNNLSSHDDCGLSQPTDLINTDPLLGTLQDNGGVVDTLVPLSGSPVIDAGADSFAPDYDARWITRPQGVASDIGAVEVVQ